MNEDIVLQGLTLMLYGMGVVFVFLSVLVVVTLAMSATVRKFAPPAPAVAPVAGTAQTQEHTPKARKHAVIMAAVHAHRNKAR